MSGKQKTWRMLSVSILLVLSAGIAFAQDKPYELIDTIVVTGTKTEHSLKDVPVETIVIDRAEIEKKNSQNIMDLLSDIPGIQTGYHNDVFGSWSWVSKMRGMDFNAGYALILIDGQRAMGCGQSGGMGEYGIGLNQVPVEMIDHIEIVKGPGSALYGSDAMVGVINIITKKVPKKPTGSAGVSYGRYDVKKEDANGSETKANGSRTQFKAHASFGDGITEDMGYFIHYNYEGADDVSQDPIKSWRHSILGKMDAAINDRIDVSLKTELSDYEKKDNREEDSYRLSGALDFRPSQDHGFALKGYIYNWDFTHGYPGYAYGYKFGDVGYNQVELQYTWNMNTSNTLVIGGETQIQSIDYTIENANLSVIRVSEDVTVSSFYLQNEAVLWDKLTLIGGARYDNHSTFGSEINPKFSLMYQLYDTTKIRASFGTSFKSPTIRQLYYNTPYRHGNEYVRSNPGLKPETAVGYGLSIEHWFMDHSLMMNLGFFRNEVDDMVVSEDANVLYNGLPLREYKNLEKAITQGIELLGRAYFTDAFSLAFAYTYTDTEDEETGKDLTYTSRHSVSLSPAYDWEKYGMGISGRVSLKSKQYTNTNNTATIDGGAIVDAKVYKNLSENAKLSFEADDIFDSAPSKDGSFYSGRTFTLKLNFEF